MRQDAKRPQATEYRRSRRLTGAINRNTKSVIRNTLFFKPFLCVLCSVFLFFLSCTNKSDKLQGYLYLRLNTNPTTLDPALIVDVTGGIIAAKIFNGLVRLDRDLNIVPDIAEKWSISEDGKIYTFHLRKGVKFSNGREVTAHDFKYSFERVLTPETHSPNIWVFEKIECARVFLEGKAQEVKGIKINDRYSITIFLEEPFTPFLNLLCMTAAYVVSHEDIEKRGADFSTYPSGTGPFVLSEWRHNQYLKLEAGRNYFEGRPKIKGIAYRIIPEDLTAIAEFESGNIDVISIPVSGPVPPALRGWHAPETYPYNPGKARSLIKEAGYTHALDIKIYLTSDQEVLDILEVIQGYLKDAGINAELRQLEWSAYKEAINSGEPDAFWLSWWADYADPENFLFPLFHSSNFGAGGNRTRYKNFKVDEMIEQGQKTVNKKLQNKYYKNAEDYIVGDVPWVFSGTGLNTH